MICFAATSYWPATADLTFPVLGVYIICIAWIIRGWMIPAFATLAAVGILLVNSSSRMSSQIISTLVMFTLISSTGLVLRSLVRKIHTSAQQLRAAQEASTAIRADLATQLHDTIAKDLARISITTQNIALNHPDLANELVPLADIVQNMARRIRPIILDLDVLANRHSLDRSIAMSAQMLTTRSITLSTDSEANLDAKLDRETTTLASLFVRESATNALKYAPSASNVDLIIELAPEILSLTMRNDVAALPQAGSITGGFGLSNLRQRIEASGGSLTFVHNDNEWVIIASIPYSR
ncbi:histidine kinase [Arcanobacterium haemolyticum]|nr:histidine kinase [Arcanobacterium haemolyticum]QCX46407.1 histidine kinase [Arcanobacterium haemolyticum]